MSKGKTAHAAKPGAAQEAKAPGATGAAEAPDPNQGEHRIEAELTQLQAQAAKAQEHWDKFLRVTADFDNFKKRQARERQEAAKYLHEPLLQKLIPILDNLDMALAAAQSASNPSVQSLQAGVAMIAQQFRGVLAEAGLEEIDATGQTFDPNWHEAVSQQETSEVAEGQVVQQLRKGYKLRDRLLRPATVVVAKAPALDASAEGPVHA